MIDTIVLNIPSERFKVIRPELFNPNAELIVGSNPSFIIPKAVQNPSSKSDIYLPRLTLNRRPIKGGFAVSLKIELSAPKLIFGNNFDELDESDLEQFTELLKTRLFRMGICITTEALKSAKVSNIHFSKNIVLTDYTTVSMVNEQIRKTKGIPALNLRQTDYENEGTLLRYYSEEYSLVLYDKVADLRQTASKAVEKEDRKFNLQTSLFDEIRKCIPLEILRIELRLKNGRKIKSFLRKKLSLNIPNTLENLFNKDIAQKALQHFWQPIKSKLPLVVASESYTPFKALEDIFINNEKAQPQNALAKIGLKVILEQEGYLKPKKLFKNFNKQRGFDKLYNELANEIPKIRGPTFIQTIDENLQAFKPTKLEEYATKIFL